MHIDVEAASKRTLDAFCDLYPWASACSDRLPPLPHDSKHFVLYDWYRHMKVAPPEVSLDRGLQKFL